MIDRLSEEQEEQAKWRLLHPRDHQSLVDRLVRSEFLSPEVQRQSVRTQLGEMLRHALSNVPYYRARFDLRGLFPAERTDPFAVLHALPLLSKAALQEHSADLRATRLPPGLHVAGISRTSGTTGRPTEVERCSQSQGAFAWLKQRELRWFRWDPKQTMLAVRPAPELRNEPDGRELADHTLHQSPGWMSIHHLFDTGPFLAITSTTPIEPLLDLLRAHPTPYLLTQSALLEHLALHAGGRLHDQLRRAQAISQTLTPAMESAIRSTLEIDVDINYGFNEVGLVASRCREGGRYHVHSETCHVELLDEQGQPASPGTWGRIVVTDLVNHAMPVLRYDTGDAARVVEGPCPCGRTLPSFGEVRGRYRRLAFLPPHTWPRWGAIQIAIHRLPTDLQGSVARYQAHQHTDGTWTVRVRLQRPVLSALAEHLITAFSRAVPDEPPPPLRVIPVETFPLDQARKFQSFLSDFQPLPDQPVVPGVSDDA